jgi:CRP-like cAMP-binding protein
MAAISPIDLLSVSSAEQIVLRCLTRHPQLTVFELETQAQMPLAEVEQTVDELLRQDRIVEQLQGGKRVFSTRFQFKHRMVRNMPAAIVNLLEQTPDAFLAEAPLTVALTAEARVKLLELGQKRILLPDEVLAWQGQKTERIWLVQQGLLAQTRLRSLQAKQTASYLHRGSWIGLAEGLSEMPMTTTYTAVTATTLLTWSAADFFAFAQEEGLFAQALSRYFSQQLTMCQQANRQSQGKLWVVEGVQAQAGVTTFALNLAWLAQQQAESESGGRTLFWALAQPDGQGECWPGGATPVAENKVGLAIITTYSTGPDRLTRLEPSGYAAQVQLDMLLSDLSAHYEYIICDTGSNTGQELTLRLRGQAQTLITLTRDSEGAEAGLRRWIELQPYSFPGQKRVLALQGATRPAASLDARFHLVIPADEAVVTAAASQQMTVVQTAPDTPLTQALHEVYRRLSLNHAVALFVPSTMDVDQQVDNSGQVRATLSFLGNLFGGATSSSAEGAWRSEESGLVTEQVTIVRTFVSKKALDTHLDDVIHFATDMKRDMKQEAVAISVDNQLILV